MEFLKIENLCKVYGKGENQVTALNHVSLTIEQGDFTAIIGSSGSGTSLAAWTYPQAERCIWTDKMYIPKATKNSPSSAGGRSD